MYSLFYFSSYSFLLEKLTADSQMEEKEVPFMDQTGQKYKVASVDVGATPCSMHIPLNQFLSMLLTCFNQRHCMADECLALGYLQVIFFTILYHGIAY